ncbi:MAG: hypothetical protein MUO24_04695 [Desulfobacterales bacterium]|nr:hypothetical protein [Desulfobacterales bacterium]
MSENILRKRPQLIPCLVAAAMLLGALADLPYGYYQLLRFVICGVSIYIAFTACNWQKMWAVWLFGFIALLFNPLIPIHLSRELWQPIDIICALLFSAIIIFIKKPTEQKQQKDK